MTAPDVRLCSYKHVATYKYIQKIAPNGRNGLKFSWHRSRTHSIEPTRTMQSDFSCYYENFTHTRSRSACFSNSTSFSGRRARELGFFEDVALCLEHYRVSRKKSKKCCVLFDFSRCFGPLRSCLERLYAALDDITGKPAAFICQWHHNNIDSALRRSDIAPALSATRKAFIGGVNA